MERGDFVHAEEALARSQRRWLPCAPPPPGLPRDPQLLVSPWSPVADRKQRRRSSTTRSTSSSSLSRLLEQLAQRIRVEIALAEVSWRGAAELSLETTSSSATSARAPAATG